MGGAPCWPRPPSSSRRVAACLLLSCWLLRLVGAAQPTHSEAEQQASLQQLFSEVDTNKDGALSPDELRSVSSSFDQEQEGWSAAQAASSAQEALNADHDKGVSAAELQLHLRALLKDHQVVDWVTHGLNLPVYAAAFKQNAITALDFPLLLSDGSATLAQDLGVTSKLHQQQILRGLKRLVLGLGELPSAPKHLDCTGINKTAVRLRWQGPVALGHPAMHKYVLQRQRVEASSGRGSGTTADVAVGGVSSAAASEDRWVTVGEPDDEDRRWEDAPPAKGTYRYRLAAWSAYGQSPFVLSTNTCTVRAVQKQPLPPPSRAHMLPAAAGAGAGSNLSAGQAAAAGAAEGPAAGTWSWSATSSAVVVGLTILLKASQLRMDSLAAALARSLWARLTRRCLSSQQAAAAACGNSGGSGGSGGMQPSGSPLKGILRVGSSRASLSTLAAEPLGGDDALDQPLLPGGNSGNGNGGGLMMSYSSGQLLSSGEPRWQAEGKPLAGHGLEELAAGGTGAAAAEQLQQAIQRGAHCAHPGCHRRFDRLRDMRRKLESHYCGLCQHMYCLQHTRISPHGPRGGCGLESKCVCYACFAELSPAHQAAYERINRLPKPGSSSGAMAAAAAAGGGSGSGAGDTAGGDAAAAGWGSLRSSSGSQELQQPAAEASAEGGSHQANTSRLGHVAADRGSVHASAAPVGSSTARKRWKKAGGVLRALVRFKQAGSRPSTPRS